MLYPLSYHILHHVLTIHQLFEGVVGVLVMRGAHMGEERDMGHLIFFKETLWFVVTEGFLTSALNP